MQLDESSSVKIFPPPHWRGWQHHLLQALIAFGLVAAFPVALGFLFFVTTIICDPAEARAMRIQSDLQNISSALRLYRTKAGRYPTTQEGLCPLIRRQILEAFPRDPWNVEYHYALWRGLPVIWSYGADGCLGGTDQNADISNRSLLPPWMLESTLPIPYGAPPAFDCR